MAIEIVALTARAGQWNHRYLVRPGDLKRLGEAALCRMADNQTPSTNTIRRTRDVRQLGGRPATEVVVLSSSRITELTPEDRAHLEAELDASLESFDGWVESADWGRSVASSLVLERPEIEDWASRIERLLAAEPARPTSSSTISAARNAAQQSSSAKSGLRLIVFAVIVLSSIWWLCGDWLKANLKSGGSPGNQGGNSDDTTASRGRPPAAKTFKNVVQALGLTLKSSTPTGDELKQTLSRLQQLYREEGETPNAGPAVNAPPSHGEKPKAETKPPSDFRGGRKAHDGEEIEESVRNEIVRLVRRLYEDNFGKKELKDSDLLSDSTVVKLLRTLFPDGTFDPYGLLESESEKKRVDGVSPDLLLAVESNLDAWVEAVKELDKRVPDGDRDRNHTPFLDPSFETMFGSAFKQSHAVNTPSQKDRPQFQRRFWLSSDLETDDAKLIVRLQKIFAPNQSDDTDQQPFLEVLSNVAKIPSKDDVKPLLVDLAADEVRHTKRLPDKVEWKQAQIDSLEKLVALLKACEGAQPDAGSHNR